MKLNPPIGLLSMMKKEKLIFGSIFRYHITANGLNALYNIDFPYNLSSNEIAIQLEDCKNMILTRENLHDPSFIHKKD